MGAEQAISAGEIGTILHVGAGTGGDLERYASLSPERIVLVEPNPELQAELEAAAREIAPATEIHRVAVSTKSGEAVLNVFNFFDLSSLALPTELTSLYPGLRTVDRPIVEVVSLRDLVGQVQMSDAHANWLVIDAPGSETALVKAALKGAILEHFQRVVLVAPRTALFRNAETAEALVELLCAEGYEASTRPVREGDPDWLHVELDRSPHSQELRRQRTELDAATRKTERLTESLAQERRQSAALKEEIKTLTERLAEAETSETVATEKAGELQRNLTLALQLQRLAQSDLEDLKGRYAALSTEKTEQENLLLKLTQRLGDAAVYLHELTDLDTARDNTKIGHRQRDGA